jgi:hypothetical protein
VTLIGYTIMCERATMQLAVRRHVAGTHEPTQPGPGSAAGRVAQFGTPRPLAAS